MSNPIVTQTGTELTVSSDALAEGMELEHRQVIRAVRNYVDNLERFGRVDFENQPFATAGGTQVREVAHLTEPQATFLLTSFRNIGRVAEFKVKLVQEFYRMRQALTGPALTADDVSRKQLALMILESEDAREAAEARVAELEPKADYVDTFVADEDLRILRNVAKSLGMQEAVLRADLLERKWIYQEKSSRWSDKEQKKVPHDRYSAYADKTRYFTPVPTHDAPRFRGEVMHTLKVTPQGAVAIARLYGKHLQIVEAA